MKIVVGEEPETTLEAYACIPISFPVHTVFEVTESENNQGEFFLTEHPVEKPYWKDYDAISGNSPVDWARQFNMETWGIFVARINGQRVGGAMVAFNASELMMLEGREDLAILWDIRVSPAVRGKGVGSALFKAAEAWCQVRGCRQLKIETQNINVPACRFYARQGCVLKAVHPFAYPEFPDEVQLLWYKELTPKKVE